MKKSILLVTGFMLAGNIAQAGELSALGSAQAMSEAPQVAEGSFNGARARPDLAVERPDILRQPAALAVPFAKEPERSCWTTVGPCMDRPVSYVLTGMALAGVWGIGMGAVVALLCTAPLLPAIFIGGSIGMMAGAVVSMLGLFRI